LCDLLTPEERAISRAGADRQHAMDDLTSGSRRAAWAIRARLSACGLSASATASSAAGTTGERLLHGAPAGGRRAARLPAQSSGADRPDRVGIDGGSESFVALQCATEMARALGAALEVIRAYAPGGLPVDAVIGADLAAQARNELDVAMTTLPKGIVARALLVEDDAAQALADRSHELTC
jgi:hypothetical protein